VQGISPGQADCQAELLDHTSALTLHQDRGFTLIFIFRRSIGGIGSSGSCAGGGGSAGPAGDCVRLQGPQTAELVEGVGEDGVPPHRPDVEGQSHLIPGVMLKEIIRQQMMHCAGRQQRRWDSGHRPCAQLTTAPCTVRLGTEQSDWQWSTFPFGNRSQGAQNAGYLIDVLFFRELGGMAQSSSRLLRRRSR